jgi:hypothetical protein
MSLGTEATPGGTSRPEPSAETVAFLVQSVVAELHEGLRHEYFELSISGIRVSGHVEVIVKSTKSRRFLLPTTRAQK